MVAPRGYLDLIGTPSLVSTGVNNLVIGTTGTADLVFVTNGTERLRVATTNTLKFGAVAATTCFIGTSSVNGADSNILNIGAGASANEANGAFIQLQGNEASGGGDMILYTGDSAGSDMILRGMNASSALSFRNSSNTEVFSASAAGVIVGATYNLADGSDKNYKLSVYATGTAYALTASSAALDFGTTDPTVTINKAGTYLFFSQVNLQFNGATFAANRTASLKLRRTNNTPADIGNSGVSIGTGIVTTVTGTLEVANLPIASYTTANTDDIITIFGSLDVAPTAGSLDATQAFIVALRIA